MSKKNEEYSNAITKHHKGNKIVLLKVSVYTVQYIYIYMYDRMTL